MRIYFSEENAATLNDRYEQCKQKYKLTLKQTSSNTLNQLQALLELAKAAHQLEGKEECTQMLQSMLDAGFAEASPAWHAALLRELAVAKRFEHQISEALELLQQALSISQSTCLTGEYAPVEIQAEIALTYYMNTDFAQAADAMTSVVSEYLTLYGKASKETLTALEYQRSMYHHAYKHEAELRVQELICEVLEALDTETKRLCRERHRLEALQAQAAESRTFQDSPCPTVSMRIRHLLREVNASLGHKSRAERLQLLQEAWKDCEAHLDIDPLLAADVMTMMGSLILMMREPDAHEAGTEWFQRAFSIFREHGEKAKHKEIQETRLLADLLKSTGYPHGALTWYERLLHSEEDVAVHTDVRLSMADVYQQLDQPETALQLLDEAFDYVQQHGASTVHDSSAYESSEDNHCCRIRNKQAEICYSLHQYTKAMAYAQEAFESARAASRDPEMYAISAARLLALCCSHLGLHHQALEHYHFVCDEDAKLRYGYFFGPRIVQYEMALVEWNTGLHIQAKDRLENALLRLDPNDIPKPMCTIANYKHFRHTVAERYDKHRSLLQETLSIMTGTQITPKGSFILHLDLNHYALERLRRFQAYQCPTVSTCSSMTNAADSCYTAFHKDERSDRQ